MSTFDPIDGTGWDGIPQLLNKAFALGLVGVRKLGMPRRSAVKALGAFAILWVVCRVVTPSAANINLAFRVHSGWEPYFPSYALYFLMLLAIAAVVFTAVERLA